MKKVMFFMLGLAFTGLALQSCSKSDDHKDTKPVITNLEPTEGERLQIGKGVHFSADISAENHLKSYKVDIHNNFDGHTHSKGVQATDSVAYSFTKTWTTDKTGGETLAGKKIRRFIITKL